MLTGMVKNWEMFRDVTGHAFEGHKRLAIIQFCLLLEGWDEANKVLWGMGHVVDVLLSCQLLSS